MTQKEILDAKAITEALITEMLLKLEENTNSKVEWIETVRVSETGIVTGENNWLKVNIKVTSND